MFTPNMRKLYLRFFALGVLLSALALLTVAPTTQADGFCDMECANDYMFCTNWCDEAFGRTSPIHSPEAETGCMMECNDTYNYCLARCSNSGPPCYTCNDQHTSCYNSCNLAYNNCYSSCAPEDTDCQNACAATRDGSCYPNCDANLYACYNNCSH
jgi:hypothetical protein